MEGITWTTSLRRGKTLMLVSISASNYILITAFDYGASDGHLCVCFTVYRLWIDRFKSREQYGHKHCVWSLVLVVYALDSNIIGTFCYTDNGSGPDSKSCTRWR